MCLLLIAIGLCTCSLTDEEVISSVEGVFPPSDGSTLSGQGAAGVLLLRPVLDRVSSTGCPGFVNSSAWPYDRPLLDACMWSVLGRLASTQVYGGGDNSQSHLFVLDTHTGTIERGASGTGASRSSSILSGLVVVLLIAIGLLMFMMTSPGGGASLIKGGGT